MEASAPSSSGLPAFDKANPAAYYLVDNREEMEALSDATLVADGVSLPVHSQVLSLQSGVLRRMFVDFRGTERSSSSSAESSPSSKHSVADKEGQMVLKEPLNGCSAHEGALFLRFCYRPEDMVTSNLKAVQSSLPALLQLAHKLEVGRILRQVAQHMTDACVDSDAEQLVSWADAAEQCEQTDLRLACTAQLAQRLVSKPHSERPLAAGIADAMQLEGCSKGTLLLLLGLVTGAGRQLGTAEQLLAYKAPAKDDVAAAQRQAGSPSIFTWRIERFSQQPAQTGQAVKSPFFSVGGRQCQIAAYLNGETAESQGHLSLYLTAKVESVRASVTLTVCDQDTKQPADKAITFTELLSPLGRGYSKFMSLEALRSHPGYLTGDTLVIRAEVRTVL